MTDLSPETVGTTPPDDPRAEEGLVEAMARAICVENEFDPDVPHPDDLAEGITDGFPMYVFYLGSARAALAAARSHGGM